MTEAQGSIPEVDEAKKMAATAIMRHFSAHPDSVLIVSAEGPNVRVDISGFPDPGTLLLAQKLATKIVDQSFERAMAQQKTPAKPEIPTAQDLADQDLLAGALQ